MTKLEALAAHLNQQIAAHLAAGRPPWQIAYSLEGLAELHATDNWDGMVADVSPGLASTLEGLHCRIAAAGADASVVPLLAHEMQVLRSFGVDASAISHNESPTEGRPGAALRDHFEAPARPLRIEMKR